MNYHTIHDVLRELEAHPIEGKAPLYHPIPFPEFEHVATSASKAEVYRKWHLIQNFLTRMYGVVSLSNHGAHCGRLQVLDVGANAGFFTFRFAQQGARVEVFESDPRYSAIGKFLAQEKKLPIIWHGTSFESSLIQAPKFDVALMLSVFQWMAAGGEKMREARENLRTISQMSDYLIFELGFNAGKSCLKTHKFNHYAALVELLRQNTVYPYFQLLGKTQLWQRGPRYLVACSKIQAIQDRFLISLWRKIRV